MRAARLRVPMLASLHHGARSVARDPHPAPRSPQLAARITQHSPPAPMPTPAERKALLFLAAVSVLGIGVRAVRSVRGAPPPVEGDRAGLAAQIAAVDSARAESRRTSSRGGSSRGGSASGARREGSASRSARGEGSATRRRARTSATTATPAPDRPAPGVPLPLGGVPVLAPEGSRPRARGSAGSGSAIRTPRPASLGPIDLDVASAAEIERLPRIGPALASRIVEDRALRGAFGSLAGLERVRGVGPAMARALAPHVTFSGTPRPSSVDEGGSGPPPRRRRGGGEGARSP
jgi:competence protein ComEA